MFKARCTIFILSFAAVSCITLKDTVVDPEQFLGSAENHPDIYDVASDGTFINPFNINTDNWGTGTIDRLMLVEFEPLAEYSSIELQVIRKDSITGGLVILYFADGQQADIYHWPNLAPDAEMYGNVLNKTTLTASAFDYSFKEIDGRLQASLQLRDRFGNDLSMEVREQHARMQPCGLLAPIGGESDAPEFMTLVFMKHFKFLSQDEPDIRVELNGQIAELAKLPLRVNGIRGYQTKYSMETVSVSWNRQTKEILPRLDPGHQDSYATASYLLGISRNEGHCEIESFTGLQAGHEIRFAFVPAIPDLQCLAVPQRLAGRFVLSVDDREGIMAGEYRIETRDQKTLMQMQATEGYSPVPGKAWMKRMCWEAEISETESGFEIESKWVKQ